jgi:hypothetical protein
MDTANIQMVTMTLLNELRETDVKGRLVARSLSSF